VSHTALAVSRGGRPITRAGYGAEEPRVTRHPRDARPRDPVCAGAADTHGIDWDAGVAVLGSSPDRRSTGGRRCLT
jgi:hypothetical protein